MDLREVSDPRVLAAMHSVPRHEFVPAQYVSQAYDDHPIPIGLGQTISQPYIVALMTELLELKGAERVLEIGTGSGYQAAILSLLAAEVHTVEMLPQLAEQAAQRLRALGYSNATVHLGDGFLGWPESAPYDAILVACAADQVPPSLVEQLVDGGRLVIPVGPQYGGQMLEMIEKRAGRTTTREITGVVFVPLRRPGSHS